VSGYDPPQYLHVAVSQHLVVPRVSETGVRTSAPPLAGQLPPLYPGPHTLWFDYRIIEPSP